MSNYPSGMTQADWQHIDGAKHYRDCPSHEGALEDILVRITAHLESLISRLNAADASAAEQRVRDAQLVLSGDCTCDEIHQGLQDADDDRRWEEMRGSMF